MNLTKNKRLFDGGWMGLWMMALVSIIMAMNWIAEAQSISTTTVQGTVYLANGQSGAGTLTVSWPAFTTANGQAVVAGRTMVTIAAGGSVSVNLAPNQGATPAGLYYTAVYSLSDGTTSTEYWMVPVASPASLGQVRAQAMPAVQAVQAVNKAYVDQSIANLNAVVNTVSSLSATGTGVVSFNSAADSSTGGVAFDSGGATPTTVATVDGSGDAQFNGTLQVNGASTMGANVEIKNNADAENDFILWSGKTAAQNESLIYKNYAGTNQWTMVNNTSNDWALNSAPGGLDSFKAFQSTNSGDTYINTSNTSGVVRINYETGSGTQFKVYGGSSSTLYAAFTGSNSIQFPGLAASSGHFCLQIDNSGYLSNTGAACGSGSGGPVFSSAIAAPGIQDTLRPVVDTFTVATGYGGGTDECAKLMQLSYNADQAGYTGNIFRSTGSTVANVVNCSVAGFFDPYLTTPNPASLPQTTGGKIILAPGTVYQMVGETDIPIGYTLDGQSSYGYLGTATTGTWLDPASTYPLATSTSGPGTVLVSLGPPSSTTASSFTLGSIVKDLNINCNAVPGMTALFNGFGQQGAGFEDLWIKNCSRGLDVENYGGAGGAQNHGPVAKIYVTPQNPPTAPVLTNTLVTSGGSYTQAPAVTISGCTTAPTATAVLTSGAVTSLTFGGPNYYGANCSPAGTTISFASTYGSGAAATPVVQMLPVSVGVQSGQKHETGGGMYTTIQAVAGLDSIEPQYGFTLDGSGEYLYDIYSESLWETLRVGGIQAQGTGSNIALGVRANPAQNACWTALDLANTGINNSFLGGAIGGSCANLLTDEQPNGGKIRYSVFNPQSVALYVRERDQVISSNPQTVTNIPIGTSYYNCGASCTSSLQPYQYLPAKNIGGYVQSMTTGDSAPPIGISTNGTFNSTNSTYTSTVATTGKVPCIFDPSVMVTAGDYVGVSSNTVVSGKSIAGCVDLGSTFPTSGWVLGQVAMDPTIGSTLYGSTAALTAPAAPTVTGSSNGGITYSYQLVAATLQDQTKSPPSSAGTTTTGPASLVGGAHNTLSGLPGTTVIDVYRTAMGSTLPTVTPVCCTSGQVTGVSITAAGSGLSFAPTGIFSGGGCTTEPSATWQVAGGALVGPVFLSYGVGCTSAPTVSFSRSSYETGWIGQTNGTTFTDSGRGGDGTIPAAGGQIAPRVAINIQKGVAATAGVSSINSNSGDFTFTGGGFSQTGNTFTFNATEGSHILSSCTAAASSAITGNGAAQNVYSCSVPASAIPAGGCLQATAYFIHTGSASVAYQWNFGGTTTAAQNSSTAATTNAKSTLLACALAGSSSSQFIDVDPLIIGTSLASSGATATASQSYSSAFTVTFTFNVASSDSVTPKGFIVEIKQP
jgi:hypothetical protein